MSKTIRAINVIGLFLVLIVSISCSEQKQPTRPNIIFIMADDHAFQAISAYDSTLIHTPNIDRLAEEGIRFDRAFVTNSICSPSRAVILTGQFSHINGLRNNLDVFDSTRQTFPKLLQQAGYETAIIGKWHLKSQPTGFDYWRVLRDQGDYYKPQFRTPDSLLEVDGYVTDIITNMAINWIENRQDTSPFLLMCQHKAPHREWMPAQRHVTDFMTWKIPEPPTLQDDYAHMGSAAREAEMRIMDHMGYSNDNKIKPEIVDSLNLHEFYNWYKPVYYKNYDRMTMEEKQHWDSIYDPIITGYIRDSLYGEALLKWRYQRYMQDYLATIKSVDESVGSILKYLDEKGMAENTVVVYTSDQGFYLGEHGWFDKRFMYEESFRTPLLIRWPSAIKAGQKDDHLVQNLDFAETFLDIAGVEIPADMQGKSLVPLFSNNKQEFRDAIYYHYYEYPGIHAVKRHYGIRTDKYKLIHFYYDIDEWELYDLEKDPNELYNRIEDPAYEEIKKDLMSRLAGLRLQYDDSDSLSQVLLNKDLDLLNNN